jgi:hypothetical protein
MQDLQKDRAGSESRVSASRTVLGSTWLVVLGDDTQQAGSPLQRRSRNVRATPSDFAAADGGRA